MSEFEKELDVKIKSGEITEERYKTGCILSHFVNLKDIVSTFKDWQPPKPLVIVPQIMADFIEGGKKEFKLHGAFLEIEEGYGPGTELYDLVFQKSNGQELFARAWIDGYMVEEEPKFSLVNKITGEYLVLPAIEYRTTNENIYDNSIHVNKDKLPKWKPEMYQFTEVEIASMETGSYERIEVKVEE